MLKHAYEIPGLQFSVPAGGAVPRWRFVSIDNTGAAVLADGTAPVIGVSRDDTAAGQPIDIADGIMMVEAGAAITAGASIEVAASGKAVTKTAGLAVGIALTGASAPGVPVAVKLIGGSTTNGANAKQLQTIMYTAADLAAGADLTDQAIGMVIGKGTIVDVSVISEGAAAGIDAANTSVFLLEVGAAGKAGITFNAETTFPGAGVAKALTITNATVAAGNVLSLSVTNGATADLPVFTVQVTVELD